MPNALRTWIDAQPGTRVIERLRDDTGVSLRALYRYASDKRRPGLHEAVRIARVTGIPLRELLSESDREALEFVSAGAV